jgi:hypothetical protein
VNLIRADTLGEEALLDLFNTGFSDCVVPLQLDAAALRAHVRTNDLDWPARRWRRRRASRRRSHCSASAARRTGCRRRPDAGKRPADSVLSTALGRLGAEANAGQHEMVHRLNMP